MISMAALAAVTEQTFVTRFNLYFSFRRMTMTMLIKDLSLDKELDRKEMSAVRGGLANQANSTSQVNNQALFAPVSVANGAGFGGGPVNIQVDSAPTQTASNSNFSSNFQGNDWGKSYSEYC
jgi:hypothetical protein